MTTIGKGAFTAAPPAGRSGAPLAQDGAAALKRLHELAMRLLAAGDLEAAMREVLDAALEMLGADSGVVHLADESSGEMRVAASRGAAGEVREMLSAPLFGSRGRLLGVLSAHRPETGASEAELYGLRLCAQQAVASVERLRATERAEAGERRYKTLFESIDDAFAVVEVLFDERGEPADYRFLETNPVYLRHTALEDVVGKTGREVVPTLEPFWVETFGRVARTGEPCRFTQRTEGIERWFDCYAFRFGDPRDRQVAVFFKDVTEHRAAELRDRFLVSLDDAMRSLVEAEEVAETATRLLAQHLGADRAAYAEADGDEEAVTITGEWPASDTSFVGRHALRDDGRGLRDALRAGGPFVVDDVARCELGEEERRRYAAHGVAATAHVPLHEAGKLRSSLAVYQRTPRRWREDELELVRAVASRCREAIERARVARRLRDSEEQFRTLADLLPQFIWAARPDGYIEWFNQYARDFFGPGAPIEGFGWMDFHDPDLLPEIRRGYAEALAAGTPYSCTTRFRGANGQYRWLVARMVPQHDAQGRVLRFLGYNFDVTDLHETQARLVDADRRKDEFLATLAHELRNPLAPLYNVLEVLKLRPGAGMTPELREMMHRQVRHLGRLIDDLLDASRITRGVVELQRKRTLLGDVLSAAIETSRPLIEASRHRLRVDAPEEPLWLRADPVRLTQVFANLLNNAAKYTDENGNVGIRVSRDGGGVAVTVSDDGIGIERGMIGRVFELFTQVDRQSRRTQGGLGIGLSLARRLVEMHGGTLEAESEGIGHGSRFTVRLPLDPSETGGGGDLQGRADSPEEIRVEVLVVDDNADAADGLGELLRSLGAEARVVYDGASALDILETRPFAAVFADLGMPVLDGLALARRIRADPRFADVRLVAVTGWGQEQDRARSRDAGFDHHLVKPAAPAALQAVLRGLRGAPAARTRGA